MKTHRQILNKHLHKVHEAYKSPEDIFGQINTSLILAAIDEAVNQRLALADVSGRSEQLKCQCKKAKFTRTVDADFNPLCGRCGKAL